VSAGVAGCVMQAPEEVSTAPAESSGNGEFPTEFDPPESTADEPAVDSELSELYEAIVDSVAAVEVQTEMGPGGGSAWVYEDSYLVTNEHVIANSTDPHVWFIDIGWRQASVVGEDFHSDLAVLEVEDKPDSAVPLPVVDEQRAVGTQVAAVGNPFDLTGSFTTGVISGLNRNIEVPGRDFSIADGIQTDAAVNPGNSGGPLLTFDGEVTGVVSAGQGETIGFAISAAMVRNVVPALIEAGEYDHSHLGVQLTDVRPEIIEANDLPVAWGVYIVETVAGEAADGVLQGADEDEEVDGFEVPTGGDVIVRMDDWDIPDSERLSAFLALETDPGDTIEIEIVRDGERETVDVTLGTRPDADDGQAP